MGKKLFTAAAAAGALYAGIGFLCFYEVTGRGANIPKYATKIFNKKHGIGDKPGKPDERVEWFRSQNFEELNISGSRGQNLRGYFLPADEPSDKYMICSHGYRNRGKGEFRFVGKFLHDQGINVIYIDHQASGDSDGKFISFGHYESADLMEWIDYTVDRFGADIQLALYGISMGSATVMLVSNNDELPENLKFIIADCGYTSVNDEFSHTLKTFGVPDKPILFVANQFSKILGEWDFDKVNPIDCVKEAKVPMLFIHGEADDFVPTFMGCRLYNACSAEKDYLCVPNAAHAQSYQTNSELYEGKLKEFFTKYFK
ncbi:MAG: alpha/beta hydrolase [Clostridia bacterium]|nr:alpha/beta hydrolase [Clostridia bacterium]